MSNETLERLYDEALASGHNNWVRIVAGAQDGLPECKRLVRELLAQQDETHWSKTSP